MRLETTREQLQGLLVAVNHAERLVKSGLIAEDMSEALAWRDLHKNAKPEVLPAGIVDLLTAEGGEVVLAAWNNRPVSFGGKHDWTLARAEKTVNESSGKVQISCLLRRMGVTPGETQYTDTVTIVIDYK